MFPVTPLHYVTPSARNDELSPCLGKNRKNSSCAPYFSPSRGPCHLLCVWGESHAVCHTFSRATSCHTLAHFRLRGLLDGQHQDSRVRNEQTPELLTLRETTDAAAIVGVLVLLRRRRLSVCASVPPSHGGGGGAQRSVPRSRSGML